MGNYEVNPNEHQKLVDMSPKELGDALDRAYKENNPELILNILIVAQQQLEAINKLIRDGTFRGNYGDIRSNTVFREALAYLNIVEECLKLIDLYTDNMFLDIRKYNKLTFIRSFLQWVQPLKHQSLDSNILILA